MNTKAQLGYSLIEMMMVSVVMSIMAIGMAKFSAHTIQRQAGQSHQTQVLAEGRSSLEILERDLTMAGFGAAVGVKSIDSVNPAGAVHDRLVLTGAPLVGPRATPWAYVVSPAGNGDDTVRVSCAGRSQGNVWVPDPATDITTTGRPQPIQIINFAGKPLAGMPADLRVLHGEAACSTPGVDYDGNGEADRTQLLTLDQNLPAAIPTGNIIVATRGYAGITQSQVIYFVENGTLMRSMGNSITAPVLGNVEAFQIQFAAADVTGSSLTWDRLPPWNPNRRLKAVRYHIVTADPRSTQAFIKKVIALDHAYDVQSGTEKFERRHIERTVRTHNTVFAHP